MLRHNAHTQAMADKFNEETRCFDYTIYRGHYDGWLVYQPLHADSRVYIEGFPTAILVKEDKVVEATIDSPWEPFEIYDYCSKHYDYLRPGRKILREYRRKIELDDFSSDEERNYITEIIYTPLNYADLCVYLSIAKRVGKRIVIKQEEDFTSYDPSQCDGWRYYIEIVDK